MKRLLAVVGVTVAMLSQTGCIAVAGGAAVGTGLMVATDARTTGSMIDDEGIEMKSISIVSNNREIYNASKFDVTAVNGRVLITGQCQDKEYIAYVKDRISKLPEVKEVINQVEDLPPVGFTQRSTDSWITTKVKTQLLFGKNINSGRFKVITENNVVYLLGIVTKSEANRAVNVTRGISGVRKVVKIFEFITDDSKINPIFKEGSATVTDKTDSVSSVVSVESAGVTRATEDAPVFYEETSVIEQPATYNKVETTPQTVSQPTVKPVTQPVVKPVTQPAVQPVSKPKPEIAPTPATNSNNNNDDYFIIE